MGVEDDFVEIELIKSDDFLKIKETLTRIGVSSNKENKLYQSCHILQKRGKFYIVHFKEMFLLDGKPTNFEESDKGRRNTIINLLSDWGLLRIKDPTKILEPRVPMSMIKIIPHKEKANWTLLAKYTMGKKKLIVD